MHRLNLSTTHRRRESLICCQTWRRCYSVVHRPRIHEITYTLLLILFKIFSNSSREMASIDQSSMTTVNRSFPKRGSTGSGLGAKSLRLISSCGCIGSSSLFRSNEASASINVSGLFLGSSRRLLGDAIESVHWLCMYSFQYIYCRCVLPLFTPSDALSPCSQHRHHRRRRILCPCLGQ